MTVGCRVQANPKGRNTREAQYIPPSKADAFKKDGWNVTPINSHHGYHSMLALRDKPRQGLGLVLCILSASVVVPLLMGFWMTGW